MANGKREPASIPALEVFTRVRVATTAKIVPTTILQRQRPVCKLVLFHLQYLDSDKHRRE